jgi:hypothetical protein
MVDGMWRPPTCDAVGLIDYAYLRADLYPMSGHLDGLPAYPMIYDTKALLIE